MIPLADYEQFALIALVKKVTGLELKPPPANRLDDQGAWIDAFANIIGPAWGERLAKYKRNHLIP